METFNTFEGMFIGVGEAVEIDHTVLDVYLRGPETFFPWVRPTLTVVVDPWTGAVMAPTVDLKSISVLLPRRKPPHLS